MAWTLIINPGSASKKYALYREGSMYCSMKFERTALGFELCTERDRTRQKCEGVSADTFQSALEYFVAELVTEGVIANHDEIDTVAVRVVVPGTAFQKHTVITDVFIHKLRIEEPAAPLHIPHVLKEIAAVQALLPRATLIATSDSAFHSTLPAYAREYSLPASDVAAHDLHRFGYHGLSVASVVRKHHAILGQDADAAVVCHIGSGVSVTAVQGGKSIFTTMGYAPGSGLIMATRAGDLDMGALLTLIRVKNWRPLDAYSYLSTSGGLQGVAGSDDLRLVIERATQGDAKAALALEMFVYHLTQGIAQAVAALGGMRTLIFTATAGERSSTLRARIVSRLHYLGVLLDADKNEALVSKDGVISMHDSRVKVAVIRTDEMGEMYFAAHALRSQD